MAFAELPRRLGWGLWAPLVVLTAAALVVWLGWFGTVFFTLAAAAAVLLRRHNSQHRKTTTAGVLVNQSAHTVRTTLTRASNDELCELWDQSVKEIRRAYLPSTVTSYADLRGMLLDELIRRDPLGVQRWLAEQPDQRGPRVYLDADPR